MCGQGEHVEIPLHACGALCMKNQPLWGGCRLPAAPMSLQPPFWRGSGCTLCCCCCYYCGAAAVLPKA